MKYLSILLGALILSSFLSAVHADTVFLDDGRSYEGTVLSTDNDGYLVEIGGMKIYLPRSRVTAIDSANTKFARAEIRPKTHSNERVVIHVEAFPPKPRQMPKQLPEPPALKAVYEVRGQTGGPTPEKNGGVAALLPSDPAKLEQLCGWVQSLNMAASMSNQLAASAYLAQAGDSGLAALVIYGLYNDLPSVREQSARLLSNLGGMRVLKPLIEAFYAGASDTVPPYQVVYMKSLADEISRLTGELFPFHTRFGANQPRVARAMVMWWNDNIYVVPPQLGEPEIDPSAADYRAVVSSVRKLTLERREFAGFTYPPSLVAGPVPNTPNQTLFLKTFPIVPDTLGNSREMPISNTPIVPKERSPALDAPSAFRFQDMAERMRMEQTRTWTQNTQ